VQFSLPSIIASAPRIDRHDLDVFAWLQAIFFDGWMAPVAMSSLWAYSAVISSP
jgi:hypothetical protein